MVAPAVFLYHIGTAVLQYASSSGKTKYALYSNAIASFAHWAIAIGFFDKYEDKMTIIAIASSFQFFVRFLVAFVCVYTDKEIAEGLIPLTDPESTKDLKEMLALGGNSILLRVMSWWAFDVFTQLASRLPAEYFAGQVILRSIGLFTYMIPVGLSVAANFLVGKFIGKNKVDLAHRISNQIMFITFMWSFIQMALIVLFKDGIIRFYSDKQGIYDAISPAWRIIAFFVFFDCMQGVSNGNISGLGLLKQVKWVSTFSYWIVGLPLSAFLMFERDMKLEGLWYGPTIAVFMNYFWYEIQIYSVNWQDICDAHLLKMKNIEKD